ncbi:MAG: site-2 protease family protein, partial [Planctomycetaceae bacterium]
MDSAPRSEARPEFEIDANRIDTQPPTPSRPQNFRPKKRTATILFICTCLSTWVTGGLFFATDTFNAYAGLSYSASLMTILVFHEMGHYLQAQRWGVPATLPFFIPMPMIGPFGTMGAVIIQGAGVANRKSLFEIAVTGPLAGLIVAIPVTFYGICVSEHQEIGEGAMVFGNPLLLEWMYESIHGPLPPQHDMLLNPYLFAGWVGIFITGLNLIP